MSHLMMPMLDLLRTVLGLATARTPSRWPSQTTPSSQAASRRQPAPIGRERRQRRRTQSQHPSGVPLQRAAWCGRPSPGSGTCARSRRGTRQTCSARWQSVLSALPRKAGAHATAASTRHQPLRNLWHVTPTPLPLPLPPPPGPMLRVWGLRWGEGAAPALQTTQPGHTPLS